MDDLIKKLEAGTEKDQHILIREALSYAGSEGWITGGEWTDACRMLHVKAYESAALMLVPEGLHWSITSMNGARVGKGCASASTPALALTIAALKAWKANE